MFEFQISVSCNGEFLFRTDWDSNRERVAQTFYLLKMTCNDSYLIKVYRSERSTSTDITTTFN